MFVLSCLFVPISAYNYFYMIEIIRAAHSIIPAAELTYLYFHMYLYSKQQTRSGHPKQHQCCRRSRWKKSRNDGKKWCDKDILLSAGYMGQPKLNSDSNLSLQLYSILHSNSNPQSNSYSWLYSFLQFLHLPTLKRTYSLSH